MQELKIKQTQDLDMTALILERQAIKRHGAIWFILFELFVLEDSMNISEFKTMFIGCVIGLPVFIASAYAGLILLSRFGGV